MFYSIYYYIKKYWYILAFILVMILIVFVALHVSTSNGVDDLEIKDDKVQIDGAIVESPKSEKPYLEEIEIGDTKVGKILRTFKPSSVKTPEQQVDFQRQLERDPYYMYRKTLNWYNYSLTDEDLNELMELIVYDLMLHDQTCEYNVKMVSQDKLQEAGYDVTVFVDPETDYLILNLLVSKVNINTEEYSEYIQSFTLHYEGAYIIIE